MKQKNKFVDEVMEYHLKGDGKKRHRYPVIELLVEQIASGLFAPGSHLPTEQQLVDTHRVSRTVIREVVQELVRMRMVETGPRVGARVLSEEAWDRFHPAVLKACLHYKLDAAFYEPLIEARGLIEPEVTAMAAARATLKDINQIEGCFAALEALMNEGDVPSPVQRVKADIAFHRSILKVCGNWVFSRFVLIFDAAIVARMALAQQASDEDPPFALEKHRRIMEAIKARNPGEARKAALSVLALSKPAFSDYF